VPDTSPIYFGNYSDRDQPTLGTVADVIEDARTLLQDIVGDRYRYTDPSLITALNVTMLEMRRVRPDLFVFNVKAKGQTPSFTIIDDTYIELEPQFRTSVVHGVIGHALERDQEDVQDARATSFLGMFYAGLNGHALGTVAGGSAPSGKRQ
jgi:hypothetical protein